MGTFLTWHENETMNENKNKKCEQQEDLFNIKCDAEKYHIGLY